MQELSALPAINFPIRTPTLYLFLVGGHEHTVIDSFKLLSIYKTALKFILTSDYTITRKNHILNSFKDLLKKGQLGLKHFKKLRKYIVLVAGKETEFEKLLKDELTEKNLDLLFISIKSVHPYGEYTHYFSNDSCNTVKEFACDIMERHLEEAKIMISRHCDEINSAFSSHGDNPEIMAPILYRQMQELVLLYQRTIISMLYVKDMVKPPLSQLLLNLETIPFEFDNISDEVVNQIKRVRQDYHKIRSQAFKIPGNYSKDYQLDTKMYISQVDLNVIKAIVAFELRSEKESEDFAELLRKLTLPKKILK
jgi:hypothetical protein